MAGRAENLDHRMRRIGATINATEAAAFSIHQNSPDGRQINLLLHVRPDDSTADQKARAAAAFSEIVGTCVQHLKNGVFQIENSQDDRGHAQYCLIILEKRENNVVGAAAFITRCSHAEDADAKLRRIQQLDFPGESTIRPLPVVEYARTDRSNWSAAPTLLICGIIGGGFGYASLMLGIFDFIFVGIIAGLIVGYVSARAAHSRVFLMGVYGNIIALLSMLCFASVMGLIIGIWSFGSPEWLAYIAFGTAIFAPVFILPGLVGSLWVWEGRKHPAAGASTAG